MKKWYSLYRNILFLHFSDGFFSLPESAKGAVSPSGFFRRVLKVAGYLFIRVVGNLFGSVSQEKALKGKVWLYVVSQNNVESLKFITDGFPDGVFVAGQNKNIGKYNSAVERISLRKKLVYYYKFFPLLFKFFKREPKKTIRFFDLIFDAVGFYEVYEQKLKKLKPKAVVFANDHNADARALLLAANSLGIKTVYIQHATVSTIFPPLQFSLSLLEGQDALDKYRQCGPVSRDVKLVGMPRADRYVPSRNMGTDIQTIGVAVNLMDDLGEVKNLLTSLVTHLPDLQIILRPHPRDIRDFGFTNKIQTIRFSDSRTESAFEFLKQIDVLLSGNSSIHLEAVLLNVWSVYIDLNQREKLEDYYGYLAHNLVDWAATMDELVHLLKTNLHSRPAVVSRAQYYNATVCSENDGKSSELALRLLKNFLSA